MWILSFPTRLTGRRPLLPEPPLKTFNKYKYKYKHKYKYIENLSFLNLKTFATFSKEQANV